MTDTNNSPTYTVWSATYIDSEGELQASGRAATEREIRYWVGENADAVIYEITGYSDRVETVRVDGVETSWATLNAR